MKLIIYFAMLLVLGLTAPRIYCAEEHRANLGKQLFESISKRDNVNAKRLIRAGANVNFSAPGTATTPLMVAAYIGNDVELVQTLVKKNAHVGATSYDGNTALHYLITGNNPDETFPAIADILLNAKANINAKNKLGFTPLHSAAKKGLYNKVQYLLSKGADPDIANKAGKYPVDLVPEGNVALRNRLFTVTHRQGLKS